jgi:hypothetical protein
MNKSKEIFSEADKKITEQGQENVTGSAEKYI